jgi:hypothetical protein
METILTDLSFEDWIRYVFDHPVDATMPEWYWQEDRVFWDAAANPTITVTYLTSLFANSVANLAAYTDAQINQGLWYISSNACSMHMFALTDKRIPREKRIDCLEAIYTLFAELFRPRCSANLAYLDERTQGTPNPLDSICYMWWDVIPMHGRSAGDCADTAIEVMADTLQLGSDACRESALHGLGHWHYYAPERIELIIDNFLKHVKDARPELILYAQRARIGYVQ